MNKEGNHLLRLFSHCPKCGAKAFVEDTEKSKRCEACDFVYYMNPSAATVAIIIDDQDRLLTVRRSKEPAKGTLDLPGGFCDCYETGEEGVKREVLEETGLTVVDTRYLFSLPNMYRYSGLDIPTLDMFFLCKVEETAGATAMDDYWNELRIVKQREVADRRPLSITRKARMAGVSYFLEQRPVSVAQLFPSRVVFCVMAK